jgi:hypothetical protein
MENYYQSVATLRMATNRQRIEFSENRDLQVTPFPNTQYLSMLHIDLRFVHLGPVGSKPNSEIRIYKVVPQQSLAAL